MRSELVGEALGHDGDGRLGGAVGASRLDALTHRRRRDVDDRPRPLLDHVGGGVLARLHVGHHVVIEAGAPLLGGGIDDGGEGFVLRGVVHEDVDPAELGGGGLGERFVCSASVASVGTTRARRPTPRTSAATSSSRDSVRAASTTSAPWLGHLDAEGPAQAGADAVHDRDSVLQEHGCTSPAAVPRRRPDRSATIPRHACLASALTPALYRVKRGKKRETRGGGRTHDHRDSYQGRHRDSPVVPRRARRRRPHQPPCGKSRGPGLRQPLGAAWRVQHAARPLRPAGGGGYGDVAGEARRLCRRPPTLSPSARRQNRGQPRSALAREDHPWGRLGRPRGAVPHLRHRPGTARPPFHRLAGAHQTSLDRG